jgi:hypothetical protein
VYAIVCLLRRLVRQEGQQAEVPDTETERSERLIGDAAHGLGSRVQKRAGAPRKGRINIPSVRMIIHLTNLLFH